VNSLSVRYLSRIRNFRFPKEVFVVALARTSGDLDPGPSLSFCPDFKEVLYETGLRISTEDRTLNRIDFVDRRHYQSGSVFNRREEAGHARARTLDDAICGHHP